MSAQRKQTQPILQSSDLHEETRPEVVRMFGQNIYITYCPMDAGMQSLGLSHLQEQLINIRDGQRPFEEKDTLLHEVIHFASHIMEADLDERQVTTLSHALVGIFQDNPEFAKFITEKVIV